MLVAANLSSAIFSTIGALFSIAMIIPSIAVGWRRMHDTGRSGWWSIIPIVGFIFALQQSDPDMNDYGPPAPPVFSSSTTRILALVADTPERSVAKK